MPIACTFAERKEKTVQSCSRLTTDNWFFGYKYKSMKKKSTVTNYSVVENMALVLR
jgi:hypothetical protein